METVASLRTLRVTRLRKHSSSHSVDLGIWTVPFEELYRSRGVQPIPECKVVLYERMYSLKSKLN